MAGTSNAREAAHMGRIQCVPRPPSAAIGQDHPPPHQMERSSPVRNRMLELGTSGTVRGEDGNILTYSALLAIKLTFSHRIKLRTGCLNSSAAL
jgi:hypothetical protein